MLIGPQYLSILNTQCYFVSVDRFEYSLCPFQNVTQRRVTGGKPTLLGVWGTWTEPEVNSETALSTPGAIDTTVISPDSSSANTQSRNNNEDINMNPTMTFTRGQSCGQTTRTVNVEVIADSEDFYIDPTSVEEAPTCQVIP